MGLWSLNHLKTTPLTFVLLILLTILVRMALKNKPREIKMLPIKIISVFLVVLEIIKQILSIRTGYQLHHLPLHFCSIFLYVLPLMAFYRGKYQEKFCSVATSTMTALLFGMLIMPGIIYSDYAINNFFNDFFAFHTVFFHNLVILALFLTLALDLHTPSGKRDEVTFITLFGTGFVLISASLSHILQTNFSNFLSSTVGFIANLVDKIATVIGRTPITVIYTLTLAALHVLLMVLTSYVYLLLTRLIKKAKRKE